MQEVVLNLLLNSIAAIETEGNILIVETVEPGRALVLVVADDGAGIKESQLAQIFHPFFSTKKEGTGLGLSICKKTIDAHGGTISGREPRREGDDVHHPAPARPAVRLIMQKRKILIVDDEKLIRWTLRQKLTDGATRPSRPRAGAAGLQALSSRGRRIFVLLDMKLPDAKGTDVLEEIRKSWPDLPVIMITAFGAIEDVVTAMRRGAYDFVTKPLDDTKLQSTVVHALEAAALKKKIAAYREIERMKFDPGRSSAETSVMSALLEMLRIIAESETSIVLLQGESGTGKDLFAQTLHLWSRRKRGALSGHQLLGDPGQPARKRALRLRERAPSPTPSSRSGA